MIPTVLQELQCLCREYSCSAHSADIITLFCNYTNNNSHTLKLLDKASLYHGAAFFASPRHKDWESKLRACFHAGWRETELMLTTPSPHQESGHWLLFQVFNGSKGSTVEGGFVVVGCAQSQLALHPSLSYRGCRLGGLWRWVHRAAGRSCNTVALLQLLCSADV